MFKSFYIFNFKNYLSNEYTMFIQDFSTSKPISRYSLCDIKDYQLLQLL